MKDIKDFLYLVIPVLSIILYIVRIKYYSDR